MGGKKRIGITDKDIAGRLKETDYEEITFHISELAPFKKTSYKKQIQNDTIRISGKSIMVC